MFTLLVLVLFFGGGGLFFFGIMAWEDLAPSLCAVLMLVGIASFGWSIKLMLDDLDRQEAACEASGGVWHVHNYGKFIDTHCHRSR
jgi:hypothetical protein